MFRFNSFAHLSFFPRRCSSPPASFSVLETTEPTGVVSPVVSQVSRRSERPSDWSRGTNRSEEGTAAGTRPEPSRMGRRPEVLYLDEDHLRSSTGNERWPSGLEAYRGESDGSQSSNEASGPRVDASYTTLEVAPETVAAPEATLEAPTARTEASTVA